MPLYNVYKNSTNYLLTNEYAWADSSYRQRVLKPILLFSSRKYFVITSRQSPLFLGFKLNGNGLHMTLIYEHQINGNNNPQKPLRSNTPSKLVIQWKLLFCGFEYTNGNFGSRNGLKAFNM